MFNNAEMTAWLVGGVIEMILLIYMLWSLFGDRSRGRKRCPACAHPFGDLSGTRCPECGKDAEDIRFLYRTRRHWYRATTAIFLMFSIAIVIRMRATDYNLMALIPDQGLVVLLNLENHDTPGPITEEIKWRLMFDELSLSSKNSLLEMLIAGSQDALPGSQKWHNQYGMLSEVLSDSMDIRGHKDLPRLLDLLPVISIGAPAEWPEATDIPAYISLQESWPYGTDCKLELRWSTAEVDTTLTTICFRNYSAGGRPFPFTLPPSVEWPTGDTANLTVEIKTRKPVGKWNSEQIRKSEIRWSEWSSSRSFTIPLAKPVPTPLELKPIDSAELDAMMAKVFSPGLRKWTGDVRPFAIRFDMRMISQAPPEVAFGVFAEIIERTSDGEEYIRRRSKLWMTNTPGRGTSSGWGLSAENGAALENAFDPESKSTWLMRISGNQELSERAVANASGDTGIHTSWWNGSIEFPLPTHLERDERFIRHWFMEDGPPTP